MDVIVVRRLLAVRRLLHVYCVHNTPARFVTVLLTSFDLRHKDKARKCQKYAF